MPDAFAYINQYYHLSLKKGSGVIDEKTKKHGQVDRADGQYIYIRWDGNSKATGPYHPTDGLEYPKEGVPA